MTPKAQVTKENIDKLDFIKIKSICASQDIIKEVRNSEQEKVFENHAYDKGILYRIYKEFL